VLAVLVSFIVVFLYCACALFVCNVCYLSVVLLYYCHLVKAQLHFNKYIIPEAKIKPIFKYAKQFFFRIMHYTMQSDYIINYLKE
jgi:hypothetical protein